MFRAIPTNNKLCFDKQLKRSWKIHQDKLKSIKSSISREPPQHFNFLDQRPKKLAIQDVKNMQINKENNFLMSKIKVISEKGSKTSYLKNGNSFEKKKTLNQGYRKKQLVKIVEQNQQIAKRILMKKSLYNVRKWSKQRKNVQKNINLISQYPFKNYPSTHTHVNLWMTNDGNQQLKKSRTQNLTLSKSSCRREDLIFSGTHKIAQSYYLIHTNLKNKTFFIEIENLERSQQRFKLELDQKQAEHLLDHSFGGKLQRLFDNLSIDEQKGICQLKCYSNSKLNEQEEIH